MKVSAHRRRGSVVVPIQPMCLAQEVNDAQIASIVVTANQVDIDAGKLAKSRSTNDEVKAFAELMISRPHQRQQIRDRPRSQAQGLAAEQSNQPESESRWREEPRPLEDAQGCCVRQSVRRSRSRVSPAGHRCARQDPDSRRNERRTEGSADQSAAGFCRAPRAREASPVVHRARNADRAHSHLRRRA